MIGMPGRQASLDVAAPEPGRVDRPRLVLEDGDRPLDASPECRLDPDLADDDPGADRAAFLGPDQVAKAAQLAKVFVSPRQVEQQVPNGRDAEARAGPPEDRRARQAGRADVDVEEGDRIGRRRRSGRRSASPRPSAAASRRPPDSSLGRDEVAVVRLATSDELDLGATRCRAGGPSDRFGLIEVGAVAVVQRQELVARLELREPGEDRLLAVVVDRDEAVIRVEDDRLALRTFRSPNFASRTASVTWIVWTPRPGGRHRLDICGRVERGIERQQRGDALGGVAGRHDVGRPVGHRDDLAGGHDDVRVVRQDEDLVGREAGDRRQELAGRRVVRLAATDDHEGQLVGHPELLEDLVEPLAGGDGDDAERQAWTEAVGRRRTAETIRAAPARQLAARR